MNDLDGEVLAMVLVPFPLILKVKHCASEVHPEPFVHLRPNKRKDRINQGTVTPFQRSTLRFVLSTLMQDMFFLLINKL